jgi:carbon storage regulator
MRRNSMLVLSRREKESIHIGNNVVIGVAEIRKSQVRLTIDAPQHVPVHRSELRERISDAAPATRGPRVLAPPRPPS